MSLAKLRGCAAAFAFVFTPAAFMTAPAHADPSAVDLLFEAKHIEGLEKGAELRYRFERKVSDEKLLGAPFSDGISIKVAEVTESGRQLLMQIFTGERARDPQNIPDFTGNPLLVLFLDRCVNNYSLLGGGDKPYLKGAFRKSLLDKAKVEPAKIAYAGQTVDGFKITIVPYAGDRNAAKMQGYEHSKFTFVVSPAVPGHFVELSSVVESTQDKLPRIEERMAIDGAESPVPVKTGEAK